MNRLVPIFVVIFAAVFGGSYVLMQRGNSPAALPTPGPSLQPADSEVSLTKNDETKSSSPTSSSDLDEGKSTSEKPASKPSPKEDVKQIATAPKPDESSPRAPNQKKQKQKRIVVKAPPVTPKPRETNGGIWDEDLDRLQGHWRMVDAEWDGQRIPEEAKKYSWDFRVDEYTIKNNGNFQELWFVEVNSSRRPKTIDSTHDITRRKIMGVYEVTDDTLKVCYDLTGNGRPDSFKAAKGSRRACYYFER
jgi:uncharacterized protein (TIGR03067 family)